MSIIYHLYKIPIFIFPTIILQNKEKFLNDTDYEVNLRNRLRAGE